MSNTQRNKEIVQKYFDVLTRNDIPILLDMYAEDMVLRVPGTTCISGVFGKAQLGKFAASVLDTFPKGLKFIVHSMVAENDSVAVEAESIGTHVSGKHYNNKYHFLIRLRDGKIIESREYMDTQLVTDVICGGK